MPARLRNMSGASAPSLNGNRNKRAALLRAAASLGELLPKPPILVRSWRRLRARLEALPPIEWV